ncbi:MAG: TolC family protein [Phycisphaerae bacterium]|nr:TolC family protein [Phycisphaerae bacterium]
MLTMIGFAGCASQELARVDPIVGYQESLVRRGPQRRASLEGLELMRPTAEPNMPALNVRMDTESGKPVISLRLEDALVQALANSPEIQVVSYDPSISKEEITMAVADFDVTIFGRLNYDDQDNPQNSIFLAGQSNSRIAESGLKQRGITGSEWSLAYALVRNWDDRAFQELSTRYEPMISFQIRQPLLRDAWQDVNLAGVEISKLNYLITLVGFRQKTEQISAEIVTAYWLLVQAARVVEIQRALLDETVETMKKLQGRRSIDATEVQLKQAESAAKERQAVLVEEEKNLRDIQDALLRLLSNPRAGMLDDAVIVPMTEPQVQPVLFDFEDTLEVASRYNPIIQQAKLALEVAKINVTVAERQKMPRLDLVASARATGLDRGYGEAGDQLRNGDFMSYAVGITLEYPLGNRQRTAEFRRRRLERSKAYSALYNVSDQIAFQVKERIRLVQKNIEQMEIQRQALETAGVYLHALENTEAVRATLTPEFLLVKLQAQQTLANARKSLSKAIVDYNIALTALAQITGTVLDVKYIRTPLNVAAAVGAPAQ